MPYTFEFDPNEPDELGDYAADMKVEAENAQNQRAAEKRRFLARPTIQVDGGKIHEMTDKAEKALIDTEKEVYQRDSWLVRIGRHPMKDHNGNVINLNGLSTVALADRHPGSAAAALVKYLRADRSK